MPLACSSTEVKDITYGLLEYSGANRPACDTEVWEKLTQPAANNTCGAVLTLGLVVLQTSSTTDGSNRSQYLSSLTTTDGAIRPVFLVNSMVSQ